MAEKNQLSMPGLNNRDSALFFGFMLGDGCISRGKKAFFVSITGHLTDDKEFFDKISPLISCARGKSTTYRLRPKQGKLEFNFSDKKLFQTLETLGFPVGIKGSSLDICKDVSQEMMRFLIAGYFATDGSVVLTNNNGSLYPRIEIKSIAPVLLNKICSYLNNLEIFCKVYSHNVPNGSRIYRLQGNGEKVLTNFREHVGFFNPKHEIRFDEYKRRKNAANGI